MYNFKTRLPRYPPRVTPTKQKNSSFEIKKYKMHTIAAAEKTTVCVEDDQTHKKGRCCFAKRSLV